MAQLVNNPPAMRETWVRSLGWEDLLEYGTATPLQDSGLENSIDCIVRGVTKSQIGLSDFHFHFLREGLRDQPGRYMHTNQQPQYRLGASRGWMLADVQAERGRQSSGGIDLCAEF